MRALRFVLTCAQALPLWMLYAQQPQPKMDLSQFGRGEGTLQAGQMAPDFTLKRQQSSETVTLSSFRGKKPVALIFGSYT